MIQFKELSALVERPGAHHSCASCELLIRLTGGYSFVTASMEESECVVNDYVLAML
jgi:hypothetical protein